MELEEGRVYLMRNGNSTGPLERVSHSAYPWQDGFLSWTAYGRWLASAPGGLDIVAEVPAFRLREGGFYKTRDGRKVGPLSRFDSATYPWTDGESELWTDDGRYLYGGNENAEDLVKEISAPAPALDISDDLILTISLPSGVKAIQTSIEIPEGVKRVLLTVAA